MNFISSLLSSGNNSLVLNFIIIALALIMGYVIYQQINGLQKQIRLQKLQIRKLKTQMMHGMIDPDLTPVGYRLEGGDHLFHPEGVDEEDFQPVDRPDTPNPTQMQTHHQSPQVSQPQPQEPTHTSQTSAHSHSALNLNFGTQPSRPVQSPSSGHSGEQLLDESEKVELEPTSESEISSDDFQEVPANQVNPPQTHQPNPVASSQDQAQPTIASPPPLKNTDQNSQDTPASNAGKTDNQKPVVGLANMMIQTAQVMAQASGLTKQPKKLASQAKKNKKTGSPSASADGEAEGEADNDPDPAAENSQSQSKARPVLRLQIKNDK